MAAQFRPHDSSDEEALGGLLQAAGSAQPQSRVRERVRRSLLGLIVVGAILAVAWRFSTVQSVHHQQIVPATTADFEVKMSIWNKIWNKFYWLFHWRRSTPTTTPAPPVHPTKEVHPVVKVVSHEKAVASHKSRQRLVQEHDLSSLLKGLTTKKRTYVQQESRDSHEACTTQAKALFHQVVWEMGMGDELDHRELVAYKDRFAGAMAESCKEHSTPEKWLELAGRELENQKPVMTEALASVLNKAGMGYRVKMQDWLLHETVGNFEGRLGLLKKPAGQKDVLKRTSRMQVPSLPTTFRAEDKWPQCNDAILRIHNQGHCGSCWAFGGLASIDARMCIASNGTWEAPEDILSRLDVTSCAPEMYEGPGADGCQGGWPHWPMEYMGRHGVVSTSCLPYYISGAGSEHFMQSDVSPPCPTHCQAGYSGSMPSDRFSSAGVQNYDWLTDVHGDANKILAMKTAIYTEGPVSFAFFVSSSFMGYSGGVFSVCTPTDEANHAVYAFGWGELPDAHGGAAVPFIEASNSWGADWGVDGHFRIHPNCVTDVTIAGTIEADVANHTVGTVDSNVAPDPDNEYWPWPQPAECPYNNGCVTDIERSDDYANDELCVSKALNGHKIKVQVFETELGYDTLTVNGQEYSGRKTLNPELKHLNGITVDNNGIKFQSDSSVVRAGFKLCKA